MVKQTTQSAQIIPLAELPVDIDLFCKEAAANGFRFMAKLCNDWRSGANRFDAPGEVLLGMFKGSELVAVGGLNIDPYINDPEVGRLRHLYVRRTERRKGYATEIVRTLIQMGKGHFRAIRLLTDTKEGVAFYDNMGFARSHSSTATHELALVNVANDDIA